VLRVNHGAVAELYRTADIFMNFFHILGKPNVGFFDFFCRLYTKTYKRANFRFSRSSGSTLEF
jgi:hypothetical protein